MKRILVLLVLSLFLIHSGIRTYYFVSWKIYQTDYSYRNNGLDSVFTDKGRGLITQSNADNGKFKVPSLRNIEFTYPYMHDGRFYTLNQVLDHYRQGVKQSVSLDPTLTTGIPLTNLEKIQLIAFLKTLSDYKLISNTQFYEPVH